MSRGRSPGTLPGAGPAVPAPGGARRGRRLAFALAAAAPLVLGGLLFAARDRLRELWHLHRLETGDPDQKKAAIEALGELRSERAVPRLLEIARTDVDLGPRAVAALVHGREQPPAELLSYLRDRPAHFRRRIIAALEQDDPCPAAGSVLVAIALHGPQGESEAVLWEAAKALQRTGKDPLPALLRALDGADEVVGLRAISLLGFLRAEPAVPALARLLKGGGALSVAAMTSLASIGPAALPALIASLESAVEQERLLAVYAIELMEASAAQAVPALVRALKDAKHSVRARAATALGAIGPASREAIPVLVAALQGSAFGEREASEGDAFAYTSGGPVECHDARCEVARALGKIGPGVPEVIAALVATLEDRNWCLALAAVEALETVGPAASEAVPRLAVLLDRWLWSAAMGGPRAGDPEAVIKALAAIGSPGPELLGVLGKVLARNDRMTHLAAEAIGQLADKAKDLAPALIETFATLPEGSWADPTYAAARALAKIGPEVLPGIIKALASEHPRVRRGAAMTVKEMGSAARDALPSLRGLLWDADAETRRTVLVAMAGMGAPLEEVLPSFLAALDDPDDHVRHLAVSFCSGATAPAQAAVPGLLALFESRTGGAWRQVPSALAAIAGGRPEVQAVVFKALEDADPDVRRDAIRAIEILGASDSGVVAALTRALNETGPAGNDAHYPAVRAAAAARLAALGRGDVVLAGLRSENWRVRSMAARALGRAQPPVRGAREALEALNIDEGDAEVLREVQSALGYLRQLPAPAAR